MWKNIKIQLVVTDMGTKTRGALACSPDRPQEYNVYVNSNISEDQRAAAFLHEMLHIWHDDLRSNSGIPVGSLEDIRHEELKRIATII